MVKRAQTYCPHTKVLTSGCLAEGLGSVLAGIFGTGSGTTSISQNVGVLAVTKVGVVLRKDRNEKHALADSCLTECPLTLTMN